MRGLSFLALLLLVGGVVAVGCTSGSELPPEDSIESKLKEAGINPEGKSRDAQMPKAETK